HSCPTRRSSDLITFMRKRDALPPDVVLRAVVGREGARALIAAPALLETGTVGQVDALALVRRPGQCRIAHERLLVAKGRDALIARRCQFGASLEGAPDI